MRTNGLGDLSERKILDIGCGTGQWLLDLIRWGATPHHIVGVDLNGKRLETERSRLPDLIRLSVADGETPLLDARAMDLRQRLTAYLWKVGMYEDLHLYYK